MADQDVTVLEYSELFNDWGTYIIKFEHGGDEYELDSSDIIYNDNLEKTIEVNEDLILTNPELSLYERI